MAFRGGRPCGSRPGRQLVPLQVGDHDLLVKARPGARASCRASGARRRPPGLGGYGPLDGRLVALAELKRPGAHGGSGRPRRSKLVLGADGHLHGHGQHPQPVGGSCPACAQKSAPTRSILLMKQRRGHARTCRPAARPSPTAARPRPRRRRRRSPPSEHAQRALHLDREVDVAGRVDDVDRGGRAHSAGRGGGGMMVMPRSRSWSMKSMTAVPSCTSPIL